MMSFTSNVKTPGEFYAVNNHGLFFSNDSGSSWKKLDILWPREYLQQTPWAIAINEVVTLQNLYIVHLLLC
jgi:hypothetical protein